MGEGFLAEDANLKRKVAIEVLPQQFARDRERLARFEWEARLLASLNHPNIATIHGLEMSDDQQLLVMELAKGETLRDRLTPGLNCAASAASICSPLLGFYLSELFTVDAQVHKKSQILIDLCCHRILRYLSFF